MTGGGSGHSSDAEGLAWLRSQPRNGERERRPLAVGGGTACARGRRLQAAQSRFHSEERESDHCETRRHSGCYERRYRVRYGNSRGDRGSLRNSSLLQGLLPALLHVLHSFGSKVAENAGDICHAVRLRFNQSLMATTAEMRLRPKLGASQPGRSRLPWGLGAARLLNS